MSYAKRIVHLPTSYGHYLVALSSVAALAFALGVTTGPLGRRSAPTAAAPDQPRTASVERAPFETGWELYDGGWAGGPPPFKLPALVRVPDGLGWELAEPVRPGTTVRRTASVEQAPFETGWELYDGGWAGGPPPFKLPALVRVPDGLGWKLADDGAADGPDTSP